MDIVIQMNPMMRFLIKIKGINRMKMLIQKLKLSNLLSNLFIFIKGIKKKIRRRNQKVITLNDGVNQRSRN